MNLSQKLAENPQATYNNLLALKYEVGSLPLWTGPLNTLALIHCN